MDYKGIFYYDPKKKKHVIKIEDAYRHYLIKKPKYIDFDELLRFIIIDNLIIYYDMLNSLTEIISYHEYQIKKTIKSTLNLEIPYNELHKLKINNDLLNLTLSILKGSEKEEFINELNLYNKAIYNLNLFNSNVPIFKKMIKKLFPSHKIYSTTEIYQKYPEIYNMIIKMFL